MNEKYVYAIDISLSNTGVAIFDKNENPIHIFSIPTNSKQLLQERLKIIYDALAAMRDQYETNLVIFENGFSRYNKSTQLLFKCHGICNLLFYDCKQVYYAPATIKKIVSGNGRSSKDEIQKIILKKYPKLIFKDEDQSDAVSVGVCYFMKVGEA